MDQQRFEALQKRVEKLERRLLLALAALILVGASFVGSVVAHWQPIEKAYAQGSPWSLIPVQGDILYFKDSSNGTTCYLTRGATNPISCVR